MKRTFASCIAILPIMAAALLLTSCIYDTPPEDEFYRTLWKSDNVPLGPFDASELTLEFLCGQSAMVKTTSASGLVAGRSVSGTYDFNGNTAVFNGLEITYESATITFLEAHRNGDTLFLLWRVEDMLYPFTTAMRRLSEYE